MRISSPLLLFAFLLIGACQRSPDAPKAQTAATAQSTASAQTPVQSGAPAQSSAPAQASPASPPPAPAVTPVAAQLPAIVARVNGEAIPASTLEQAIAQIQQRSGVPLPAERRSEALRGLLDRLIGYRLLVQEAQARKITAGAPDVDRQLAQFRAQFPSDAALQQALAERKLTVSALKGEIAESLVVAKLLESVVATEAVPPAAVEDFYAKNPDKFMQPESVRASHILIKTPEKAAPAVKQKARATAERLLQDARAGKDFAALAKEHSDDGSAASGGDLGRFERGRMVPPFDAAAFALAPGQLSDIVETQFGYHIIKVTERHPPGKAPIEQVRPQIEQFLAEQQRRDRTEVFVNALKAKGKVEILI